MSHGTGGESYMFPIDRVFHYAFSPADDLFPPVAISKDDMTRFECTLLNEIRNHKDESSSYVYPHIYDGETRGPSYTDLDTNPFVDMGDYYVCRGDLPENTAEMIEERYDNDPVVVNALRTARDSIRDKRKIPKSQLEKLPPEEKIKGMLEAVRYILNHYLNNPD